MSPERVFWRPPPPDRSEGLDFFECLECPAPSVSLPFLALNSSSPLARVAGRAHTNLASRCNGSLSRAPLRHVIANRRVAGELRGVFASVIGNQMADAWFHTA